MTQQQSTQQPTQAAQPKNLPLLQKNITDSVMERVHEMEESGGLITPPNYSAANQIKAAFFVLQQVEDKQHRPALEVCDKASIANAILDMVVQGLSVSKKQGYFIVYGTKLEFQRSYFGTVALAKQCGMKGQPVANVIYQGDNFQYEIDTETGLTRIVKHEQKFENIDITKIRGAYAITVLPDESRQVTIMNIDQIRKAWGQGATKGNSPAHQNFTDEMCKKTVIGRACKMIINSSDDAYLFDGKRDEMDTDNAKEQRQAAADQPRTVIGEDTAYEEVKDEATDPAPQPAANNGNLFNEEAPY
ncbi:MAG TPA: recombinase RecT [Candidatus Bacteroides pullicola]|uniref:Recombinase RecT n=1 Tax=Candidatus Bacteroides pullicola TaxID=2838475 RepID=A0A9D1ZHS9_9BACE|nr:recombinase RecT [Candidatus Bacteroides pullicola]